MIAGNVYAARGSLVADPPYWYQPMFLGYDDEDGEVTIWRTTPRAATTDSVERIATRFRRVAVRRAVTRGQEVPAPEGRLVAEVELGELRLVFPVDHYNRHEDRVRWQVETGPVPLPDGRGGLAPAYVFFSRLDELHAARQTDDGGSRFYADAVRLAAEIRLVRVHEESAR